MILPFSQSNLYRKITYRFALSIAKRNFKKNKIYKFNDILEKSTPIESGSKIKELKIIDKKLVKT